MTEIDLEIITSHLLWFSLHYFYPNKQNVADS